MNRTQQYLAATLALTLPFLYLHTWNPFSVNGPHFLSFYILLSLVVYVFPVTRKLSFVLLILGIARIIQGLYNGKPVLYLLLLVVLNIILTLSINASIWKTQRSSKE
ncbi:hypothetical protein [Chitinophaga niabensis]|uniref:Uncharacterized protein n=1 Tax=Chitinophaga niabensis TaxID=536979 RepID=A0A1N6D5J0_9BACT|nr:hypothetical protein [Chitinophaga niabensis]SIN66062.1 hypothetical protein SAMN04488055_0307 [Chitinophaga niabensis]